MISHNDHRRLPTTVNSRPLPRLGSSLSSQFTHRSPPYSIGSVHVTLVQLCRRRVIYVQHVTVLIPHDHIQTQQFVSRINYGRGQQFDLFHLISGQISGQNLRPQLDQLSHLQTYWLKAFVVGLWTRNEIENGIVG